MSSIARQLTGRLIVSCQPVTGGPLDRPDIVVAFARAAVSSGAAGVRIEGLANVAAARSALSCPIIGLVKRDLASSPVRITPLIEDVMGLAKAGADIIACDTTDRGRPVAAHALLAAIKHAGKLAMADTSGMTEAGAAVDMGFDLIGTTMSGYTGGPEPDEPDFAFVAAAAKLARPLIAEGRFRTPEQAAKAISLGAHAVVAGSAITRPEHITSWFAAAIAKASLA